MSRDAAIGNHVGSRKKVARARCIGRPDTEHAYGLGSAARPGVR